ncbi:hypothetical protein Dimus_000786, partial [Dionaea muscipula]
VRLSITDLSLGQAFEAFEDSEEFVDCEDCEDSKEFVDVVHYQVTISHCPPHWYTSVITVVQT